MSHSPNKLTNPRLRRHRRVRKKVSGTAERPRLAVFRSKRHIVAQVIDDRAGHTIVAASSIEASLGGPGNHGTVAVAPQVGTTVAERAKEAGITQVTFDRGGYQYHGRVAALADAARAAGLDF
jgi:large subunit ribosomal protein L18